MKSDKKSKAGNQRTDVDSDPIATGVGAAAGGVAGAAATGAAMGAAAGPLGVGAGAAAGAVVGGLAGHAASDDSDMSDRDAEFTGLDRFVGYEVVDHASRHIGTLECLWSDDAGQPEFIGVRTGWFFGRTHVVPAHAVEVSEQRGRIKLPYSEDKVKAAPSFDPDATLSRTDEDEVYAYYGIAENQRLPYGGFATESSSETATENVATRQTDEGTIKLAEEELRVGKREVDVGGVRLRKVVRTEVVNQPVELKREEVVIERMPARGEDTDEASFSEEEIFIPLRREEAVIEKRARLREEVRAHKNVDTRQENVSGEVRREDIDIQEDGDARVRETNRDLPGSR